LNAATKIRGCALAVAEAFGYGLREFLAMVAVIAAYMLAVQAPGSAVERAVLAAVAPALMGDETSQSSVRPLSSGPARHDSSIGASDEI
jgi:ABC-type thiamin/hydroxymethylpyrimidine transport system permease subunit